jgi:hypothetical protein
MPSSISAELIRSYQQTDYIVLLEAQQFVLKIDIYSASLRDLHTEFHVTSSAFITAYNPRSKIYSQAQNVIWQDQLEKDLRSAGFIIINGIGHDPDKQWPGEPAFLVIGISLNDARALGQKYEQNAIVYSQQDAIPKLEFLW